MPVRGGGLESQGPSIAIRRALERVYAAEVLDVLNVKVRPRSPSRHAPRCRDRGRRGSLGRSMLTDFASGIDESTQGIAAHLLCTGSAYQSAPLCLYLCRDGTAEAFANSLRGHKSYPEDNLHSRFGEYCQNRKVSDDIYQTIKQKKPDGHRERS